MCRLPCAYPFAYAFALSWHEPLSLVLIHTMHILIRAIKRSWKSWCRYTCNFTHRMNYHSHELWFTCYFGCFFDLLIGLIDLSREPKTVYVLSPICVRVCTIWHETHHPGPDAYPDTATIFIQVFILIQDIKRCWDSWCKYTCNITRCIYMDRLHCMALWASAGLMEVMILWWWWPFRTQLEMPVVRMHAYRAYSESRI